MEMVYAVVQFTGFDGVSIPAVFTKQEDAEEYIFNACEEDFKENYMEYALADARRSPDSYYDYIINMIDIDPDALGYTIYATRMNPADF